MSWVLMADKSKRSFARFPAAASQVANGMTTAWAVMLISALLMILPGPSEGTGTKGCSPKYGQCGGKLWKGPTCCQEGTSCLVQYNKGVANEYYSQCLPAQSASCEVWGRCSSSGDKGCNNCPSGSRCVRVTKDFEQCIPTTQEGTCKIDLRKALFLNVQAGDVTSIISIEFSPQEVFVHAVMLLNGRPGFSFNAALLNDDNNTPYIAGELNGQAFSRLDVDDAGNVLAPEQPTGDACKTPPFTLSRDEADSLKAQVEELVDTCSITTSTITTSSAADDSRQSRALLQTGTRNYVQDPGHPSPTDNTRACKKCYNTAWVEGAVSLAELVFIGPTGLGALFLSATWFVGSTRNFASCATDVACCPHLCDKQGLFGNFLDDVFNFASVRCCFGGEVCLPGGCCLVGQECVGGTRQACCSFVPGSKQTCIPEGPQAGFCCPDESESSALCGFDAGKTKQCCGNDANPSAVCVNHSCCPGDAAITFDDPFAVNPPVCGDVCCSPGTYCSFANDQGDSPSCCALPDARLCFDSVAFKLLCCPYSKARGGCGADGGCLPVERCAAKQTPVCTTSADCLPFAPPFSGVKCDADGCCDTGKSDRGEPCKVRADCICNRSFCVDGKCTKGRNDCVF